MARTTWLLTGLLAAGCIKPNPAVQATQQAPIAVVAVLDSYDDAAVRVPPEAALALIDAEIGAHNLVPQRVDSATLRERFAAVRTTDERLAIAAAEAAGAPAVLLFETDARFGAQVNGRYRWSVTAELSVAPTDAPDDALTASVTVPVHLVYYKDKEDAAVAEAAPVIARHVGSLLDAWIGATGR